MARGYTAYQVEELIRLFQQDADWSGNLNFDDAGELQFGNDDDVSVQWDGTNLIIATIADDKLIEIGDAATSQLSFDLKWYGNGASGADYLYFDASANLVYTTGIDLQFKDDDFLVFGTGSGSTGDVNIEWDTAGTPDSLIIAAAADDTVIQVGASAATQLSFDVKIYGNTANGADYILWDASDSQLEFVGGASIEMGTTGTPLALTAGTPIFDFYSTCASTDGGTSAEPFYLKSTMTGAGGVGGRARFHCYTNVVLGGWCNALKSYMEFGSSGRITGLASSMCVEMVMPNVDMGSGGAYFPLEIEYVAGGSDLVTAGGLSGNHAGFIYMATSGDADGDFDDNGFLFHLTGVTDGSGHLFYANKSVPFDAYLKIGVNTTTYYIGLLAQQAAAT